MIGNDASNAVDHPAHYVQGKFEAIEIIEAFDLDFTLGNALKYILRCKYKGRELEDLKKAQWHLNHAVSIREPKRKTK